MIRQFHEQFVKFGSNLRGANLLKSQILEEDHKISCHKDFKKVVAFRLLQQLENLSEFCTGPNPVEKLEDYLVHDGQVHGWPLTSKLFHRYHLGNFKCNQLSNLCSTHFLHMHANQYLVLFNAYLIPVSVL